MIDVTQVFSDLVRCQIRLYNAVDQRLRTKHGLVTSQWEVLRLIGTGQARTVGDVAAWVPITVGAASKSVDRLEASGWVERSANPQNRRSSLLSLTAEGARLVAAATPTVENVLQSLMIEPLSDRAVGQLGATLARLRPALEAASVGESGQSSA